VVPLEEGEGMVYPSIQISDKWGLLTVNGGGALLRSDWRWVIVSAPLEIYDDRVIGNGWVIELNEGYFIEKRIRGIICCCQKISSISDQRHVIKKAIAFGKMIHECAPKVLKADFNGEISAI